MPELFRVNLGLGHVFKSEQRLKLSRWAKNVAIGPLRKYFGDLIVHMCLCVDGEYLTELFERSLFRFGNLELKS